jgi:hypothetical protein
MDRFLVTVGQLVLSHSQDVPHQINMAVVDNPGTDLFVFPKFAISATT